MGPSHPSGVGEDKGPDTVCCMTLKGTCLRSPHQMGFAREISDRVCFLYEGKIAEQGTPDEIFGNPRNERTQQFLSAVLDAR